MLIGLYSKSLPAVFAGPSATVRYAIPFRVMLLKTALCFAFLLSCSVASAQFNNNNMNYDGPRSGIGLVLGAGVDVPLHNLSPIYRAAPAFDAGVTKRFGKFTLGLNAGYRQFQPKQSAYNLVDEDASFGTISYSRYAIFSVYASGKYEAKVSRNANLYGGINLGTNYTSFSYSSQGSSFISDAHFSGEFAYFAPKIGISFSVGEDVQLGIETRFNMYGSASYNYDSRYGSSSSSILYTTWATGAVLSYQFP